MGPTLTKGIDGSWMLNPSSAAKWRRTGSSSPFLAASMIRFAISSRTLAHARGRSEPLLAMGTAFDQALSSKDTYWIATIFIFTCRRHGRERRTQSPMPKFCVGDAHRLRLWPRRCLIQTDHFLFFSLGNRTLDGGSTIQRDLSDHAQVNALTILSQPPYIDMTTYSGLAPGVGG